MIDAAYFFLAFTFLILAFYGGIRIAKDPILGVCLFIFLSSITITPSMPLIGDRLVLADFVMMYTILVCILKGSFFYRPLHGLKIVDQLALCFILLASLSSIVAIFRGADAVRSILFLFIYAYGYCCFRLIIRLITDKASLERVLLWWTAGACLVIIIGTLAGSGLYQPSWTVDPKIGRISATFKKSAQIASYLGPAILVLFTYAASPWLSKWRQLGVLLLIFAGGFVLLASGSRIALAILFLTIGGGIWIVISSEQRGVKRSPFILTGSAATISFIAFAVSVWTDTSTDYGLLTTSPFERSIKIFSEQHRGSASLEAIGGTRYTEVSAVIANLHSHPLFGTGSGHFSSSYSINEVHNSYFSVLGENGIMAFIFFLFWWSAITLVLKKSMSMAPETNKIFATLTFYCFITLMVYQVTTNGLRQRPFWFVPAIALCGALISRRSYEQINAVGFEKAHIKLNKQRGTLSKFSI